MSPVVVGIIDYDAGNLRSISNAFEAEGATVRFVSAAAEMDGCSHLVLPGVGAFPHCMRRLLRTGLVPRLTKWAIEDRRPVLGICVGMQLLADSGSEVEETAGLGWVPGRVDKLQAPVGIRIPHVGWNDVSFAGQEAALSGCFYFDHSFALRPSDPAHAVGMCDHGGPVCAAVRRGSVVGVQFHPEKSQAAGLRLMRWFINQGTGGQC